MEDLNQASTGEVEQNNIEQSVAMEDTIRDALRDISERNNAAEPAADTGTQDAAETSEQIAQRTRDEQGKFSKEPATEVDEAPADTNTGVPKELQTLGLRKDEAAAFAAAPEILKQAFLRRSNEMHQGVEQYKQAAQFAQSMERAITPYAATLRSLNLTADKAVSGLMEADQRLRNGDIQYFASLAKSYNFNPAQLAEMFGAQQPSNEPRIDPNVHAAQQRIDRLEAHIQNQELTAQQQAQNELNSQISAFAADPSHSHFESVKGHMAALLQAGQAKDLADAYEQAVYANPTTRAAMLQQQAAAQREEAAKKAQAAKAAASVNVRSRPSMPVSKPIGSMDDTIRDEYRRLTGAAS